MKVGDRVEQGQVIGAVGHDRARDRAASALGDELVRRAGRSAAGAGSVGRMRPSADNAVSRRYGAADPRHRIVRMQAFEVRHADSKRSMRASVASAAAMRRAASSQNIRFSALSRAKACSSSRLTAVCTGVPSAASMRSTSASDRQFVERRPQLDPHVGAAALRVRRRGQAALGRQPVAHDLGRQRPRAGEILGEAFGIELARQRRRGRAGAGIFDRQRPAQAAGGRRAGSPRSRPDSASSRDARWPAPARCSRWS